MNKFDIKYNIETKDDIVEFVEWMEKNHQKYIDRRYRLMILNNVISAYYMLEGNLNFKNIGSKKQIKLMWEYINKKINKK